jgi:predicted molibdopterin-dependent oxidoreductase YjgC
MLWEEDQRSQITPIIHNIDYNIIDHYQSTDWYVNNQGIDVPVLGFQFDIARAVAQEIDPDLVDRVEKIRQDFVKSRASSTN